MTRTGFESVVSDRALYAICTECGSRHEAASILYTCDCPRRGNLIVHYGDGMRDTPELRTAIENDTGDSLWRYEPLLPGSSSFRSRLSVGRTPLYAVGPVSEVELFFKDETRNPSGSLKDRASEVVLALARERGVKEVLVASTGNAAASTACIGAAMGMSVSILIPKKTSAVKLAQAVAYGAAIFQVNGSYDDAYELSRRITDVHGVYNRNTGHNPFTREGKKTCSFEIAEQLGWQSPDWVLVPTGDGNILSGIWKGFRELHERGLITKLPRLVAAQARSSNAIALALDLRRRGVTGPIPEVNPETIADSISVRAAGDRMAAVAALMESNGLCVEVSDPEMVSAVKFVGSKYGLFVESGSAAAFAAFESLRRSGVLVAGDTVVCVLTGSGLKDFHAVLGDREMSRLRTLDLDAWRSWPPTH